MVIDLRAKKKKTIKAKQKLNGPNSCSFIFDMNMKTTLYSLSPIRTILIKAPLSITFKEAGTFTKTAITAGKTNGGVAQSVLCLPVDYPTKKILPLWPKV